MGAFLKNLIFSLLILLSLLLLPITVFASNQTFEGRDTVVLDKDQVVDHDYFATAKKVIIDGTINGDAFIAGGQININGIINGDLLVAGGQVAVGGTIAQNIRAAGGKIIVRGIVGRNVALAGGDIIIDKNAKISGNVIAVGGTAKLSNNILGDVTAAVGALEIASGSTINGNLNYWSNNEAIVAPDARILRSTTFHQVNFSPRFEEAKRNIPEAKRLFSIITFTSYLIFGVLLIKLMPIYSQKTAVIIMKKFWLCLLVGLVFLVVTPIAAIILLATILGIPIAALLLLFYVFTLYVSKLFAALAIGKIISTKTKWNLGQIWAFIIGLTVYYLVGFIPVIGLLAKMLVMLAGAGAFIMQKKYYFEALRNKKML